MAIALKRYSGIVIAALVVSVTVAALWFGWARYTRDYVVTVEEDGSAVTSIIAEQISGASSLKVSQLSGVVQSTAQDVRGFGFLKSGQVVKMPYSVDYFVDVSRIGPTDLQWDAKTKTLIVDAPDVRAAKPNVDESERTLVKTNGLYVTREAGEELSRRVSANAQARAKISANSPERMAQAREYGRAAIIKLMAAPMGAMGFGDARIVVTFPMERADQNRDRWDVTAPLNEVLAKDGQGR